MKPLKISHSAVTSKALLRMADSIPGAWIGIRIAGLLLLLSGWKSTAVSRLFGLSRQAVVDWVGKANRQGLNSIYDVARYEKKLHRIVEQCMKYLLVLADESGISLHTKLGRVWAKRGSQPTVATTSHHGKRLNLFGWVEPLKGWHGLFRWPKGNTDGF